jgi:hypothetical protein
VTKLASATRKATAKRIEFLLSTPLIVGAEISTALLKLFIGMHFSFEFQFGSRIAFRLRASGSVGRPTFHPFWLHYATIE